MTKETVEAVILVYNQFKDFEQTALWLRTQNLNIGGTTPIQLLNSGRGKKLISFIKSQLGEPEVKELPPLVFPKRTSPSVDQATELINIIYGFDLSPNFDLSFVESVENQIENKGWVSENQLKALQNIVDGLEENPDPY